MSAWRSPSVTTSPAGVASRLKWKDFRRCPYNEPSAPDNGLQTRAIYGFGIMRNDGHACAACAMRFERIKLIGLRIGE